MKLWLINKEIEFSKLQEINEIDRLICEKFFLSLLGIEK